MVYRQCEIIVAHDLERAIGFANSNTLPWHLTEDLARFRSITTEKSNSVLIMGRNTFNSLGGKTLKKRVHIVLTTQPSKFNKEGVHFTDLKGVPSLLNMFQEQRIFIIGGQKIYEMFIDVCHTLHITLVHTKTGGDVVFPMIDDNDFKLSSSSDPLLSRTSGLMYQFFTYTCKHMQEKVFFPAFPLVLRIKKTTPRTNQNKNKHASQETTGSVSGRRNSPKNDRSSKTDEESSENSDPEKEKGRSNM